MESALKNTAGLVHHTSHPCSRLETNGYPWSIPARRLHNTGLKGRSVGTVSAALGSSGGPEDVSHQLQSLVDTLRDEAFWRSQQPHYGTTAAKQLLQQAQSLAAGVVPGIPAPTLQLPALQLPSIQLPSLDAFNPGDQQSVAQLFEAGQGALQGAGASISDAAARLGSSLSGGDPSGLQNLEPHYGTHAVLRAADSLLAWLQRQSLGSLSFGALGGGATLEMRHALQSAADAWSSLGERAQSAPAGVLGMVGGTLSTLPRILLGDVIGAYQAALEALVRTEAAGIGGYSPSLLAWLFVGAVAAGVISAPRDATGGAPSPSLGVPLPWDYDAEAVAAYWAQRPVAVAQRSAVVLLTAAWVGSALFLDRLTDGLARNAPARAAQVRAAIERLGPAYVKVAQAVSTRVDLLSPAYLLEIERLQDRVPPFPTSEALVTMAATWGRSPTEVLAAVSPEPIAAASLGQVYRATLAPQYGGGEVAVKVQRPRLREAIALDLFLMRRLALYVRDNMPSVTTDWVGLIDEWAGRFFAELDYEAEARNAATFKQQMAQLEGITVAEVLPALSSREVLTTDWVSGEKLCESTASDVRLLCSTLLNCYLIQLLETGLLHADPHPGNLLRTADGRICILDFGLMTEVGPDRRIALVEYIAHLSVQDWQGVARDLVALGFAPEDGPDLGEAGLVEPLGAVLTQLSKGGGAKGINIEDVTAQLEALTKDYPFQIPSYFALILRAFSVIEGIALRVDPDYSIVQECFPYIARRLLTDNNPRTRAALRQLLYANKSRIDIGRLRRLSSAFGAYTVSGLTGANAGPPAAAAPAAAPAATLAARGGASASLAPVATLDDTTRDALKLVFSTQGSYAQEVLVEELVAAVDSLQRYAVSQALTWVLGSPPAMAGASALRALGPWRPLLLPLPTPLELLSRLAPAVAPTPDDAEALASVQSIVELLRTEGVLEGMDAAGSRRLALTLRQLAPLLPELAPGIGYTGELFVKALIRRTAQRLRQTPYAGNMRAGLVGAGFQMGPSAGGAAALQMRPAPAMAGGYQKRPPPEGSAFQSQPVAFNRTIATPRGPTIVMREL